jgi:hypothetical protein
MKKQNPKTKTTKPKPEPEPEPKHNEIPDFVEDYLDPKAQHIDRLMDKNDIGVICYMTPPFGRCPRRGWKKPPKPRRKR